MPSTTFGAGLDTDFAKMTTQQGLSDHWTKETIHNVSLS